MEDAASVSLVIIVFMLLFAMGCGSTTSKPFPVTGNFSNATLSGQFAFILSGTRVNITNGVAIQSAYQEAGVFTANGNGSITAGSEDVHQLGAFPGFSSAAITGSYSIGKDGNGLITLSVGTGVETWSITMVSSSKFYLAEADASVNFSANAAGEGEMQDTTVLGSIPSGSFAFRVHQLLATLPSNAMVGQFTATAGSVVGEMDVEQGGILSSSPLNMTGTVAPLDATGRGTFDVTVNAVTSTFNYYVVNATTLLLLESDSNALGIGRAEAQSIPFSATTPSGSYAFGSSGDTQNNVEGVSTAGVLTVNGIQLNGSYDSNRDAISTVNQAFTGAISSFDPSTGRAAVNFTPTGSGAPIQEVWYFVNPARAFSLVYYPNLPMMTEDGFIDQQVSTPFSNTSLKGQYALLMSGYITSGLLTRVGTFIPDGNGNLELNESTNLYTANPILGNPSAIVNAPVYIKGATYSAASNGRVTASGNNLVLYLVSPTKAYALQGSSGAQMFGPMEVQQ